MEDQDLNLPFIEFDRKFNYKIGVTYLSFQLENKLNMKDGELLLLKTNLVDLNMANPDQSIFYMNYMTSKSIQYTRPCIVLYEWVSLMDFKSASFEIRSQLSNKVLTLNNIFLQIEINRIDSYGRIQ